MTGPRSSDDADAWDDPDNLQPVELSARSAATIKPLSVDWLWPGWLPAARSALLSGRVEEGKTAIALDVTARLTKGSPLPDDQAPKRACRVGILSAEDNPADTLVPRLIAAGANLARVVIIGNVEGYDRGRDGDGWPRWVNRPWSLPGDAGHLQARIERDELDVVIVDPLSAFLGERVDSHRDASVRAALAPLEALLRSTGCAFLGVRHVRKGGASDAREAGLGSVAFGAAVRVEWIVGPDPSDPTRKVLAQSKNNLQRKPRSLAYSLGETAAGSLSVTWHGPVDTAASELVGEAPSADNASDRAALAQALGDLLADGPRFIDDLKAALETEGFEVYERSLRRARVLCGAEVRRKGFGGKCVYALVGDERPPIPANDAHAGVERKPRGRYADVRRDQGRRRPMPPGKRRSGQRPEVGRNGDEAPPEFDPDGDVADASDAVLDSGPTVDLSEVEQYLAAYEASDLAEDEL